MVSSLNSQLCFDAQEINQPVVYHAFIFFKDVQFTSQIAHVIRHVQRSISEVCDVTLLMMFWRRVSVFGGRLSYSCNQD